MVKEIDIASFFNMDLAMIDVRSPGEFAKAHIPGAINIPLFSDEERAHVGTVYVQQSKEKAIELGYKYVNPKLNYFISETEKYAPGKKVVVHCWRGGMRSHAFAQHLYDNGFSEVFIITGGYKAYRTFLHSVFDIPFKIRIVGGYTGSAKTIILRYLQDAGFQVVDLECLAMHKGSAFGGVANFIQPSVEQFENNLFEVWRKLDFKKVIWLEDESHNIGGVNIPMNLFSQMRCSPVYFFDIPQEERAKHLVNEYAEADPEMLAESIRKISKRLDGQKTKEAFQFLLEKKYYEVALIALAYYDKSYLKGMKLRDPENVFILKKNNTNAAENALSLIQLFEYHERNKINPV